MSIEKNRSSKSSPFYRGEDCKEETEQSSGSLHHTGGVCDGSMLRKEGGISREICHREAKASTEGTTSHKKEALSAMTEVGVLRSSDKVPVMGMEQRRGSCASASEVERERRDGSKGITTRTESEEKTKVRKLQRTLYRQAKKNPTWKAWSLYGDLCSRELLEEALWKVIANGGKPGIDGMSVEALRDHDGTRELWLTRLEEDLRNKTYIPKPIRRVYIPKGNGEKRPLGIPTVKDRTVQMAVKMLIEPIFEADFHENSFGYRPKRRAHEAIEAINKALRNGRREIVDADLSSYFDTIPHAKLMRLIKGRVSDGSILKLIKGWLRAEIVEEDKKSGKKQTKKNRCGTPQGGVISPLLANIYLDALDKAVNMGKQMKAVMVRYADDMVLLCYKGRGKLVCKLLKQWLERRELKLNEEKTRIVDFHQESLEFLGFRMNWRKSRKGKYYSHTEPSPKSCQKMREAIRMETRRNTLNKDEKEVFGRVNQRLRGWAQYYHYGNSTRVLSSMQRYAEGRMRRWLWKRHNKTHGQYTDRYNSERLHQHYGLIKLPLYAPWKHS
jgi:RNA-directed DNA polymerase